MGKPLRPPTTDSQEDGLNRTQWRALVAWRPAWGPRPPRLTPLTPEASSRRYLRATDGDGSVVLQLHPRPIPADDPFLRLQRWLAEGGWPVVRVVTALPDAAIVVLEDLGDTCLSAATEIDYEEAIDLLADLHRLAPAAAPLAPPFDAHLFRVELRLFLDTFTALTGWRRGGHAEAVLGPVCDDLARLPQVVCHRDYHRRNLMVTGAGVRVIDFQDARLGPRAYDLASLLEDPYTTLPEATRHGLRARYTAQAGEETPGYALAACQRLMKAAGTYCNQRVALGNPAYLEYVAPALTRALEAARHLTDDHPDLAPLLEELVAAWEQRG